MDELDILKKNWNSESEDFKSYSNEDLKPMLHKKSSSIVKTLFYISIAELVFWILASILPYVLSASFKEKIDKSYENPYYVAISIFSYVVILVFIYLLFKSYKAISTTDNAKRLLKNILRTRKVIKYYVLFNLVMIFLSIPISFYFEYQDNMVFHDQLDHFNNNQMLLFYGFVVIVAGVFLGLVWLFYRLIYGILLKKLNKNYKELKKLEV